MGASLKTGGNGGSRRKRRAHVPMSEINVTPFVDVMLVLLIIFMVAAPLLTAGVPVDLPRADGRPLESQQKEPVVISVTQDGKIYFGQEDKITLPLDELEKRLKAVFEARGANQDDPVYIRGDKSVPYGTVMDVLSRLRSAGYRKANIVIESKTSGG